MAITKKQRHDVEMLIYKVMDTLDPTEQNSAWYNSINSSNKNSLLNSK